jgi:hypothetical protein
MPVIEVAARYGVPARPCTSGSAATSRRCTGAVWRGSTKSSRKLGSGRTRSGVEDSPGARDALRVGRPQRRSRRTLPAGWLRLGACPQRSSGPSPAGRRIGSCDPLTGRTPERPRSDGDVLFLRSRRPRGRLELLMSRSFLPLPVFPHRGGGFHAPGAERAAMVKVRRTTPSDAWTRSGHVDHGSTGGR